MQMHAGSLLRAPACKLHNRPALQPACRPHAARRVAGARRFSCSVRAAAEHSMEIVLEGDEGGPALKQSFMVTEGCELHAVPLQRPLGATMAEQKGKIVIERIKDGTNAAMAGLQLGDVVRGTTARAKDMEQETVETSNARSKAEFFGALVLMDTRNESFDTVMAAINSSRCASCDVTLIVERKKGQHAESPQSHMDDPTLKTQS